MHSWFIGMTLLQWDKFSAWCKKNNIIYHCRGGYSGDNVSPEENENLIKKSIIAPTLQSDWQIENKYIPCRIFKNISYGKMGIVNNPAINELFDYKLIYNSDIDNLCDTGLQYIKNIEHLEIVKEIMDDVMKIIHI